MQTFPLGKREKGEDLRAVALPGAGNPCKTSLGSSLL